MNDRQTGRTTRQMQAAPQGAVFVWCNSRVEYPIALAKELGREDLVVQPMSWLDPRNVMGRTLSGLVLDHAAPLLSDAGYEALMYARSRGIPESANAEINGSEAVRVD